MTLTVKGNLLGALGLGRVTARMAVLTMLLLAVVALVMAASVRAEHDVLTNDEKVQEFLDAEKFARDKHRVENVTNGTIEFKTRPDGHVFIATFNESTYWTEKKREPKLEPKLVVSEKSILDKLMEGISPELREEMEEAKKRAEERERKRQKLGYPKVLVGEDSAEDFLGDVEDTPPEQLQKRRIRAPDESVFYQDEPAQVVGGTDSAEDETAAGESPRTVSPIKTQKPESEKMGQGAKDGAERGFLQKVIGFFSFKW